MSLKSKVKKVKGKPLGEACKVIARQPLKRRVNWLKKRPPVVEENKILFYSAEDYSDNPRALFEYMIDHGYNEKYKMVWLVGDTEPFKDLHVKNVRFVRLTNSLGVYSYEARREALTSKYLFYSHSMNWSSPVRMDQVFIDLWHGCGYKGQKKSLDRKVFFDYCLVPGEIFIPVKSDFFSCPKRKILPIGYPRYDWFKTSKSSAAKYAQSLLEAHQAKKLVIWMPTFRQSLSENLDDVTSVGAFDLPIITTRKRLGYLDALCSKHEVVLLLKRHHLQVEYELDGELTNIVIEDSDSLAEQDVNLYELLAHSDGLISDYSSVAIDYLLVDKPIAFALDDFEEYEFERGWSLEDPLRYMPGHHMYDYNDFKQFIVDVAEGNDSYRERRAEVRAALLDECDDYCGRVLRHFNL